MTIQLAHDFAGHLGYVPEDAIWPAGPVAHSTSALPRNLQSFRFSTADLPAEEQFDGWRASYSAALDLHPCKGAAAGFVGNNEVWDLGSLVFSRVSTENCVAPEG